MKSDVSQNVDFNSSLLKFSVTDAVVRKVLKTALSRGGVLSELFFESLKTTRILYEQEKVEEIVEGCDQGVGLRVIFDNRSVYGYTTQLDEESLAELAKSLSLAVESDTPSDAGQRVDGIDWRLPPQDASVKDYRVQKSSAHLTIPKRIEYIKQIDQAARRILPNARQVSAALGTTLRNTLVVNSDGVFAPTEKELFQVMAQVVGEKEGRIESAYVVEGGFVGEEFFDDVSPRSVGKKAAQRVVTLLEAQPAPAGRHTVVLSSEAGGTMIHEAVGHGLEADLACNGLSVYEGKLGQEVASPLITVIDDGSLPKLRGSYAYDDEGTAAKKNVLIEKGKLRSYLVDRLSAMKFDLMATGNGRRESFRHNPMVRMTNTYIAPGVEDPEMILKDTKKGIFVKAMGGGQVNTVTGDFVFAITEGYLIEDGKIGPAIRGATLVGNGPQVIREIDRVGNDLGFIVGTCGKNGQAAPVTDAQPTLRIPQITVGGQS